MREALIVALMLATAAMAGCIGGDGGEDAEAASETGPSMEEEQASTNETEENATDEAETGPEIEAIWHNGTAQGGALGPYSYCAPGCDASYTIEVTNDTTGIVAEANWEADRNLRLDLVPPSEYCETGPAGVIITSCPERAQDDSGDPPVRVEVTDPERLEMTGEWEVQLWPQDSYDQSVEFVSVASLASGGELPQGFAKLAQDG